MTQIELELLEDAFLLYQSPRVTNSELNTFLDLVCPDSVKEAFTKAIDYRSNIEIQLLN